MPIGERGPDASCTRKIHPRSDDRMGATCHCGSMSRFISARRQIVGLATALVVTVVPVAVGSALVDPQTSAAASTCPAGAPVLQVANPNPGDVIPWGDYIISGTAADPSASGGSGIARVDLFLGDRDNGGQLLASAVPASNNAFQVEAKIASSINGGRDFVAYAYSAVDSQVTRVAIPVYVGAAPTATPTGKSAPTPVPLTETTTSSCQVSTTVAPASTMAGPAASTVALPSTTVAPGSPATASAATQPGMAAGVAPAPILSLGNPSAGAVLSTGDMFVSGVAYDPSAPQGTAGMDRVELFLDSRDSGGTILGSGAPGSDHVFTIEVNVPAGANGGHTFYAYAHSSVSGLETVSAVPVNVGAAPTATPRPSH